MNFTRINQRGSELKQQFSQEDTRCYLVQRTTHRSNKGKGEEGAGVFGGGGKKRRNEG